MQTNQYSCYCCRSDVHAYNADARCIFIFFTFAESRASILLL